MLETKLIIWRDKNIP